MLTDQGGLAHVRIGIPLAKEQLSQERVQGLLFATELLTATAVLLVKSAEEPLQDSQGSLLRVCFFCGSHKQGWVFGPVGRIFGQGGGREDKGRGGQGGKISVEGGDRLEEGTISVSQDP